MSRVLPAAVVLFSFVVTWSTKDTKGRHKGHEGNTHLCFLFPLCSVCYSSCYSCAKMIAQSHGTTNRELP